MPDMLVTRKLPGSAVRELAASGVTVRGLPDAPMPRGELLAEVRGCAGLLCQLSERIDAEVLDAAGPQLRVVSNYAVGTNNVDLALCAERGVWVGCTPDVLTDATADLTWALILAAARRLGEAERLVRSGAQWRWAPELLLGQELRGATLAIIGPGRIGEAVARRSVGWQMPLVHVSRGPSPALEALGSRKLGLLEALATADIVSLHVPLTPHTHHMLGAEELAACKPGAILVNTARGPIIDEAALASALRNGPLAAAGLDVYEDEPSIHPDLLTLDNVVLAPHIGSATTAARVQMAQLAVANLLAPLRGLPPPAAANRPTSPATEPLLP